MGGDDETQSARALWLFERAKAVQTLFERSPGARFLPFGFSAELRQKRMPALPTPGELNEVRDTGYYWWWKCLKLSPEYPKLGDRLEPGPIADVYRDFGELGDDFDAWWARTGRWLFAERIGPAVEVLADYGPYEHTEMPRFLLLSICLGKPRKEIDDELKILLDREHDPSDLLDETDEPARQRHFSQAKRSLNPMARYRWTAFKDRLEAYAQVNSQQDQPNWTWLGALSKSNAGERTDLGKKLARRYKAAEKLIDNAVRGVFPVRVEEE